MNKKGKIVTILLAVFFISAAVLFVLFYVRKEQQIKEPSSFEECLNLGYLVLESYPRQCVAKNGKIFTENIGNELEKIDLIKINSPRPNEIISSPIIIKGEARGFWFFEADFPAEILSKNGNVLGIGIMQAQSEWMTENFVPFEGIINFKNPEIGKGYLILRKDNPSGLPEHDDQLKIPVIFGKNTVQDKMKIKVFFSNNKLDPGISCVEVFSFEREIPKTQAVAKASLEELLKGPSEFEKSIGFFTNINPGVKINSIAIRNGILRVDFNEQLEFQTGGSCRVSAIRAQITETLKQFSSVNEVIISINNRTEDILQP